MNILKELKRGTNRDAELRTSAVYTYEHVDTQPTAANSIGLNNGRIAI